ncbi:EAL domain-containing protein, partial [Massilia arenosa]
ASPAPAAGSTGAAGSVGHMTDQLANSLTSLQAVSLRLTALIDLGISLSAERDPNALLRTGCRVARDICMARYACVGVLREDGSGTALVMPCGEEPSTAVLAGSPRAGVLGTLLDRAQPLRQSGLSGDPQDLGLPGDHPPVHSFLGVPLVVRERVRGWLYLADKTGSGAFSEVDERVAATVAAQVAVAYENLQLYDEIRLHHAQLKSDLAARQRLDEELRRFRTAMDATADAIFLLDRTALRFVDVNATACAMFGYGRDEFLALQGQALDSAPAALRQLYELLQVAEQSGAITESTLTRRDGARLVAELQCRTLRAGAGWMQVAVVRDISERKATEQRLLKLSHFDTLTGLPNRTQFKVALGRALEQAQGHAWSVGVLLLDIDRFKTINDTLGHGCGDRLLQLFASRLVETLRVRDTIGRFGGDEFGAILMLPDSPRSAMVVVDKLREAIARPFVLDGRELSLTASIGVAVYPTDAAEPETLLRFADNAMYRAKADGNGAFRFFTAEMNAESMARLDLENALRHAIDHGEFVLYYQPKVHLGSGRISGAEALLRWQRPGHGMVSPAVFIPVLEETGLIVRVGQWVIEEACRAIAGWSRAGMPVQVSVNVSGVQFVVETLEEDIKGAIGRHGISPELLELELTESSLMSNAEQTIAVLRNLKALGVQISVDDFGTGYSSLAYLKRFPLDKLKIDIAFVREVTSNPDDAAIVLAIINMAHSLNLKTVAEGVEREAQLSYLRRHGCDEIQGFWFSRPVEASAFEAMLAQGHALAAPGEHPEEDKPTLLIVDDDSFMLDVLSDFLAQDGYRILTAHSAAEGFDLLARHHVQVILCDQCMPMMSGTEFMERAKTLAPHTFRIMLSAYADLAPIISAINQGAIDRFYTKPWKGAALRENIREGFRLLSRQRDGSAAYTQH